MMRFRILRCLLLLWAVLGGLGVTPAFAQSTWGYDGTGSTDTGLATQNIICTRFTAAAENGTISKLSVEVLHSGSNFNIRTAIYQESGGVPTTKLAEGAEVTASSSGFKDSALTYAFTASTDYFLCAWKSAAAGQILADTGGATANYYKEEAGTYPNWPNPFGTPDFSLQRRMHITATYTATVAGGGAPSGCLLMGVC